MSISSIFPSGQNQLLKFLSKRVSQNRNQKIADNVFQARGIATQRTTGQSSNSIFQTGAAAVPGYIPQPSTIDPYQSYEAEQKLGEQLQLAKIQARAKSGKAYTPVDISGGAAAVPGYIPQPSTIDPYQSYEAEQKLGEQLQLAKIQARTKSGKAYTPVDISGGAALVPGFIPPTSTNIFQTA